MKSYKIFSELTEKQIEADVANFFGWISPIESRLPYILLDVNEQITGADKKYDSVIPIYMQFKVSEGLTQLNHSLINRIPTNRITPIIPPLQAIRIFRKENELYDRPTLYFKLREKAKNALDFQHNVLLRLSCLGKAYAFYVAPLTLFRKEYEEMLFAKSERFLLDPFYYERIEKIHQLKWVSYFGRVPFLRAHVSIIPHENVDSANHFYSFSTTGTEIAWHSGKIMTRSASRLVEILWYIFSRAFNSIESWNNCAQYLRSLKGLSKEIGLSNQNSFSNEELPVRSLLNFGNELYQAYNIRQWLLLASSDSLLEQIK